MHAAQQSRTPPHPPYPLQGTHHQTLQWRSEQVLLCQAACQWVRPSASDLQTTLSEKSMRCLRRQRVSTAEGTCTRKLGLLVMRSLLPRSGTASNLRKQSLLRVL